MTNKLAYARYILTKLYPKTQDAKLLLTVINTLVLVHQQFSIQTSVTDSMKRMQQAFKESPVVFSRNASLVIADEGYDVEVLTPTFASSCLQHTVQQVQLC